MSKLGAGRPKDIEFVCALLTQGYIKLQDLQALVPQILDPTYRSKVQTTLSLAELEHEQATKARYVPETVPDLSRQWKAQPGELQETGPNVALSETEIIQDAGRGRCVS